MRNGVASSSVGDASASWRPDERRSLSAIAAARSAVADPQALGDLRAYYAVQSNYAGATFTELKPNHPYELGVADLLAVTTLSVDIPPPAIRRLLSAETTERIASLLQNLDPDLELSTIEAPVVAPLMAKLYELIKRELRRHGAETSNAWVTASKICARKRPRLYPVRDSVVVTDLGLTGLYAEDWPVFADILKDATVRERLQSLAAQASTAEAEVGDQSLLLKHLDTVLWMRGQRLRRQRRASVAQPG